MLIGYMRVSSSDDRQVVDLQLDALLAAGVDERHLHQDKQSGGRDDRAGLKTCLAGLRAGDVLVVWKLDRLGRSLSHLVRILDDLRGGEGRSAPSRKASTQRPRMANSSTISLDARPVRAVLDPGAGECRAGRGRRRGRRGGRPPAIDPETVEQIVAALDSGSSKSAVCRTFRSRARPSTTPWSGSAGTGWADMGPR